MNVAEKGKLLRVNHEPWTWTKFSFGIVVLALIYTVSGVLGQQLAGDGQGVSLVWPPTGVAVAALACWGLRLWPGILIGTFLVNYSLFGFLATSIGFGIGNTCGPLLAAWLLQRSGFQRGFPSRRHAISFIGIAAVSMAIPPSNGMFWQWIVGNNAGLHEWINWYAGDIIGVVLFAPAVLAWTNRRTALGRLSAHPIEAFMVMAICLATMGSAFLIERSTVISFVALLPLLWVGIRFGIWASSVLVLVCGMLIASQTALGYGPFVEDAMDPIVLLAIYMAFLALMNLLVGSVQMENTQLFDIAHKRHERLEMAVTAGDVVMWDIERSATGIAMSNEWLQRIGYDDFQSGDAYARWCRLIHPDDADGARQRLEIMLSETGPENFVEEIRLQHADGTWRWLLARARREPQKTPGQVSLIGCFIDITSRRTAEQDLRDSEARGRVLVDHSPHALVVFDLTTQRFRDCNQVACDLFGYDRSTLLTLTPVAVSPAVQPDGRDSLVAAREQLQQALDGAIPRFEWMHQHADGHELICEVTLVALPSSYGGIVLGEVIDISARKRAQRQEQELFEQRQHALRMEALGTLAGGIAHDFNNLLSGILGHAENGLKKLKSDDPQVQRLQTIKQASLRGRDLVRQIMAFSRHSQSQHVVMDVRKLGRECIELLRSTFPPTIIWELQTSQDVPSIRGDSSQILQVIMNLVTNAQQALPQNQGIICVAVRAIQQDGEAWVELQVSDSGSGMSQATIQRACEPFFTTKAPGQGTGLGLAVVFRIIQEHQAQLHFDSTLGKGTCVTVRFPATSEREQRDETSSRKTGTGCEILIVDDEKMLVDFGVEQLRMLGYQGTGMTDPYAALAAVTAEPHRFAALMTDLTMPSMSGLQLARAVREIAPHIVTILCSGYISDFDADRLRRDGITVALEKPVEMEALKRVLQQYVADKSR